MNKAEKLKREKEDIKKYIESMNISIQGTEFTSTVNERAEGKRRTLKIGNPNIEEIRVTNLTKKQNALKEGKLYRIIEHRIVKMRNQEGNIEAQTIGYENENPIKLHRIKTHFYIGRFEAIINNILIFDICFEITNNSNNTRRITITNRTGIKGKFRIRIKPTQQSSFDNEIVHTVKLRDIFLLRPINIVSIKDIQSRASSQPKTLVDISRKHILDNIYGRQLAELQGTESYSILHKNIEKPIEIEKPVANLFTFTNKYPPQKTQRRRFTQSRSRSTSKSTRKVKSL